MRFEDFAAAHGLILRGVEYGKWIRVPTEDHPRKRNGAYKHIGEVAWVQNHATMSEPVTWFPESQATVDRDAMRRMREKAAADAAQGRAKAARKAAWILSQCEYQKHAYLDSKGFPEETGLVWTKDGAPLLAIPMRHGRDLAGVQLIDINGSKRFLSGQRCGGVEYVIDAKGTDVWCEGYATGLSIRQCLSAMKIRYKIHICFSAGNLATMATGGIVIADNDASGTGEAAAKQTGLPYFMPPIGDFNDYHRELGTFRAGLALKRFFMR